MSPTEGALSADSVLDQMVRSLPTPPSDSTQTALVKDPYAAVALFAHACMILVGFRLLGLGEDHKIGKKCPNDKVLQLGSHHVEQPSDLQTIQTLPGEWSKHSSYEFRYAHSQSSMEYLIKVHRLGTKTIIMGVGLGDDKTASFEIKTSDFISDGSVQESATDSDKKSALRNIFISNGRIADLVSLFKLNIIQKLAPGISKAGYEETQSTLEQPRRRDETRPPERDPLRDDFQPPARPYPFDDPLAAAPRRPQPVGDFPPPGFEDEYDLNRPPRGMPGPGGMPFGNIGERDLYPPGLGPNDPLRIGPGGGGFRGGGGMHPTFDDPIFGGQGGQAPFDPRAPPGARYDPVGPGDGPPNIPGGRRFPGGPRGGPGGMGGNPFGGFGGGDFI
jgi:hypothetical protein